MDIIILIFMAHRPAFHFFLMLISFCHYINADLVQCRMCSWRRKCSPNQHSARSPYMTPCSTAFLASDACGHPSAQTPQGRARRPSALTPLPVPDSCGLVHPGCSGFYDAPPSPQGGHQSRRVCFSLLPVSYSFHL